MLARFIARAAASAIAKQHAGEEIALAGEHPPAPCVAGAGGSGADALPLFPGARWLELGAGTGVVGLAAAVSAGCHVTLSDLPAALGLLSRNAEANAAAVAARGGAVDVRAFAW